LSSGNPGGRGIHRSLTPAELVLGQPFKPLETKAVRIAKTGQIFDVEIDSLFVEKVYNEEFERAKNDLAKYAKHFVEAEKEASKFRKEARVYSPPDSTETWASRWFASPIAYLFPEVQQEEWLGDLYETNYKMLLKGRHRWELNINNTLRTIELIESALRVKLSEWVSVLKDLW